MKMEYNMQLTTLLEVIGSSPPTFTNAKGFRRWRPDPKVEAAILVSGVTEILKKLGCIIAQEIGLALGVKDELRKLQNTLEMIAALAEDAENKQVKDKAVRLWLRRLKDVAYDADDILDDFSYEAIRRREMNRKRDKGFRVDGDKFEDKNDDDEALSTSLHLNISSLRSLVIRGCPALTLLPDIPGLTSLRGLTIQNCGECLKSLPYNDLYVDGK